MGEIEEKISVLMGLNTDILHYFSYEAEHVI